MRSGQETQMSGRTTREKHGKEQTNFHRENDREEGMATPRQIFVFA